MNLFARTKIALLGRALDAYALRQKAIASNLANGSTPGYRPKTVEFEEQLSAAMDCQQRHGSASLDDSDVAGICPRMVEQGLTPGEGDETMASGANDVDIDYEMAELAKNQIRFKFAARFLTDSFKQLQNSIRGQS